MTYPWQEKINFCETRDLPEHLPGDWFAIFISDDPDASFYIYLKPLNESYHQIFPKGKGEVLTFQRNMIDEHDKEYALEVLNLFNLTPNNCLYAAEDDGLNIRTSLSLIKQELSKNASHYVLVKTLLKVLLLQLIRLQNAGFISYELNQKRIYMFLHLMEQEFKRHTTADYYARKLGIGEKRLNQILKEKLNKTAIQIIHQRQVTEIKRMLQAAEYTIKEIAFQLNFQSLSNFTRFFKRYTGQTPRAYKEEFANQAEVTVSASFV